MNLDIWCKQCHFLSSQDRGLYGRHLFYFCLCCLCQHGVIIAQHSEVKWGHIIFSCFDGLNYEMVYIYIPDRFFFILWYSATLWFWRLTLRFLPAVLKMFLNRKPFCNFPLDFNFKHFFFSISLHYHPAI